MSSDTGEALNDPETLKRVMRAARGGKADDQQIIVVQQASKGGDVGFAKFKDAIFVAVVLAVGGATWNQSVNQAATNAKLETTVQNLERVVADLAQQLKELNTRTKP